MDRFFENAKRRIQYASLKAEKVEEYVALHADPFLEIMYDFRRGNMRNYTIWLLGTELYCYLETVPGTGLLANGIDIWDETVLRPRILAIDEWGDRARPCFLPNEEGLYFIYHTEIAHVEGKRSIELYDVTVERAEDTRKRRVLRASILSENVEEYRRLWESASVALSSVLAQHNVGNLSVSLYGSDIYVYYEYCGEQYEKDIASLRNDATVTTWKTAMEACLTPREDGSVYEEFKQIFYSK